MAGLLLALLLTMVQSSKVLLGGRTSARQVNAQEQARPDYFYLPPGSANVSSITEAAYTDLIGKFLLRNFNRVFQQAGQPLIIPVEWNSPYFAAHAQNKGPYFQISLLGGMARAPGATMATLAGILCHELGHIMGGEPRQTIVGGDWASTEGQSDFFAASVCLPDFFRAYPEFAPEVSSDAARICGNNLDCGRVLQTGLQTVRYFQQYSYREFLPVSLHTPEKPTGTLIRNSYPTDQCRLDSFVSGGRCQLGGLCRAPICWLPDDQE